MPGRIPSPSRTYAAPSGEEPVLHPADTDATADDWTELVNNWEANGIFSSTAEVIGDIDWTGKSGSHVPSLTRTDDQVTVTWTHRYDAYAHCNLHDTWVADAAV